MTILLHELRRNRLALIVWTAAIAGMLLISVIIYPQMKASLLESSKMFSEMGDFSTAFGMDKMSFSDYSGYAAVEFGNVLGLGGALFAALTAISVLSGEEKEHTAEFLLTHPVKRSRVAVSKLAAVCIRVLILNIAVSAALALGTVMIGERLSAKQILLLFLAYTLMQIEIASICFGISAFLHGSGIGIGIGLALLFYIGNLFSNLVKDPEPIKYLTPFSYADGVTLLSEMSIPWKYAAVGLALAAAAAAAGFLKFTKKDVR